MLKLKDMINNRKQLIKEYDNKLRLAVANCDDVEIVQNLFDTRNTLMDELITLQMFHKNKK